MDISDIREYCLSLPAVEETTPFDETTLVYKIGGKIFLLTDIEHPTSINIKCEPDQAIELRDRYDEIQPGWHMNKKYWNTVKIDGDLPATLIRKMIRDSYELVFRALPKIRREALERISQHPNTSQDIDFPLPSRVDKANVQ